MVIVYCYLVVVVVGDDYVVGVDGVDLEVVYVVVGYLDYFECFVGVD